MLTCKLLPLGSFPPFFFLALHKLYRGSLLQKDPPTKPYPALTPHTQHPQPPFQIHTTAMPGPSSMTALPALLLVLLAGVAVAAAADTPTCTLNTTAAEIAK